MSRVHIVPERSYEITGILSIRYRCVGPGGSIFPEGQISVGGNLHRSLVLSVEVEGEWQADLLISIDSQCQSSAHCVDLYPVVRGAAGLITINPRVAIVVWPAGDSAGWGYDVVLADTEVQIPCAHILDSQYLGGGSAQRRRWLKPCRRHLDVR